MSAASDYLEKAVLDHVLGGSDFTRPATVYFALFTAVADGDAGSVTDVSGNNYSRASVTNNNTNFPGTTLGTGRKASGTEIAFPTASGAWGTVTHWGIYDASSAGNLLFWGTLTSGSRSIVSGDTPRFTAGSFAITCA